jgi:non-ribosomal peptide synthase protein (TIGR01720 family)
MEFFPGEEVRDHEGQEAYANIPATEATDSALIASLRTHCAAWLPEYLIPSTLVVLPELPVLVSGKIDRASLPEPDLGATVAAVSTGRKPQTERESVLCGIVASLLGLPTVGADDDFFALGGDSIVSIQVVIRAREVGLVLTPRQVFQHRTAAALALQAASAEDVRVPRDPPSGDVPLTPILRWLDQTGAQFDSFSQSMVFSTPAGLELADLESMWGAIVRKHPVLNASLRREEGVLRVPADPVAPGIRRIVGGFSDQVYRAEADGARNRLDPSAGEMTRLVWFDVPHSEGRLLVVIHHTVVDGVSWRILEADLASAWMKKELEPAGTSFRRWSEVLQSESNRRKAELGAWREILRPGDRLITPRPLDPVGDRADVHRLTVRLPTELTRSVLGVVPAAFHAEINDVLLTALALAGLDWRRRHGHGTTQGVLIALEGHGREEFASGIDLSRTLGWFTSVFPVRLDPGAVDVEDALAGGPGAGQALKRIKEQIRAIPDRGLGFGVLRYLNAEAGAELGGYDGPQISFNYLGRFGSSVAGPWRPMAGYGVLAGGFDDGMPVAPYSLEINAFTQETAEGPQLGVTWAYPAALFDEGAVRDLAGGWFAALAALVAHTVGPAGQGAGGHTPSDLTLNTLSQDEIDEFESEWDA